MFLERHTIINNMTADGKVDGTNRFVLLLPLRMTKGLFVYFFHAENKQHLEVGNTTKCKRVIMDKEDS